MCLENNVEYTLTVTHCNAVTGELKKIGENKLIILIEPSLKYKCRIANLTLGTIWDELYDTYSQAEEFLEKHPCVTIKR